MGRPRYSIILLFIAATVVGLVWFADPLRQESLGIVNRKSSESDTLVVYIYYDGTSSKADTEFRVKGPQVPVQTDNLQFFLRHGLQSNVDYLFILNGHVDEGIRFPERSNIHIIRRENKCYDIGSFKIGVEMLEKQLNRRYRRFVMINASVRGPFMPTYTKGCWTDLLLSRLNERVKLVGTTYNCRPRPHVQSQVLAMDRDAFNAAAGSMQCWTNMHDAVMRGEVQLTQDIRNAGYGVDVLMTSYHTSPNYGTHCTHDDPNLPKGYYEMTFHPYEVMFIKANRLLDDHALALYAKWHDEAWDVSSCPYHIK
ncbi:uncharacterized protein SPPG_07624 [Spizellomyces punctatus DAOM BR117]|uniref:Uncharacterized protein n=1 Tax=Spizellomyces punctatus (strain DAOM BR117) TaxID=645134 RepID=A0A0L0H7P2_SPIPD|nr:uncharacterized protein SPPG_07624 [Spizellomyces punctatus DAOM BR117]KNC97237.1 hypothetical protein SPPG_07624 [Spizellomyces punctatus DAOM BR117]|eukprot:XP_016605277.1 hypothetical protein SPPG_07624 [Spizellomyces punctatus DAOM BR117]